MDDPESVEMFKHMDYFIIVVSKCERFATIVFQVGESVEVPQLNGHLVFLI